MIKKLNFCKEDARNYEKYIILPQPKIEKEVE